MLPKVGCNHLRNFHDSLASKPCFKTLQMDDSHRTRTLARSNQRVISVFILHETDSATRYVLVLRFASQDIFILILLFGLRFQICCDFQRNQLRSLFQVFRLIHSTTISVFFFITLCHKSLLLCFIFFLSAHWSMGVVIYTLVGLFISHTVRNTDTNLRETAFIHRRKCRFELLLFIIHVLLNLVINRRHDVSDFKSHSAYLD